MSRLSRSISSARKPSTCPILSGASHGPIPGRSRIGTAPDTSMSTSTKITVSPLSSAYSVIRARWLAGFVDESLKRESLSGASRVLSIYRSVTLRPGRVRMAVAAQRRPHRGPRRRPVGGFQPDQVVRPLARRGLSDRTGRRRPDAVQILQRAVGDTPGLARRRASPPAPRRPGETPAPGTSGRQHAPARRRSAATPLPGPSSGPSRWRCQQAERAGLLDGLVAPVRAELVVDVAHVGLDGVDRQVELVGDLGR